MELQLTLIQSESDWRDVNVSRRVQLRLVPCSQGWLSRLTLDLPLRIAACCSMSFARDALVVANAQFAIAHEQGPDTLGGSPAGNLRFSAHVVRHCRRCQEVDRYSDFVLS